MGTISIWHWLILLAFGLAFGLPMTAIYRRIGWNPWWSVPMYLPAPLFVLIAMYVIAFRQWPADRKRKRRSTGGISDV